MEQAWDCCTHCGRTLETKEKDPEEKETEEGEVTELMSPQEAEAQLDAQDKANETPLLKLQDKMSALKDAEALREAIISKAEKLAKTKIHPLFIKKTRSAPTGTMRIPQPTRGDDGIPVYSTPSS